MFGNGLRNVLGSTESHAGDLRLRMTSARHMSRILSNALLIFIFLSTRSALAQAPTEKPTVVPLKEIWAFGMPRSRDIAELDRRQRTLTGESLFEAVMGALGDSEKWKQKGQLVGPGFVASGSELDALRAAHNVLVKETKPPKTLSSIDEVWLVFFACGFSGHRMNIERVQRRGQEIDVRFEVIRDVRDVVERMRTPRLGLIPLGRLSPGAYHVKFTPLITNKSTRTKTEQADQSWISKCVSNSFSFTVENAH
jgi:hypothetical protein